MKRWVIAIGAALLPILLLIAALLYLGLRPLADSVTPQKMAEVLEEGYMQVERAEGYCELQGNETFAALFRTESWDKISYSAGEPILILEFAEEYYLFLYENGVVQAYDGYASFKRSGSVYYQTGVDCKAVLDYVAAHGETEDLRLRWQG